MRISELINEAGLIGKLGTAVGKAAKVTGAVAGGAVGMAQRAKAGAEKWQGTGFGLTPNATADGAAKGNKAAEVPGNVDPNELRDLLNAVLQGQQLSPEQQKTAQKMKAAI